MSGRDVLPRASESKERCAYYARDGTHATDIRRIVRNASRAHTSNVSPPKSPPLSKSPPPRSVSESPKMPSSDEPSVEVCASLPASVEDTRSLKSLPLVELSGKAPNW